MAEQALPKFEKRTVVASTVRIVGAGDGLSESLALDPTAYGYGDEITLVLRGRVTQVNHRAIKRDQPDLLQRQHTLTTTEVAVVPGDAVEGIEQLLKAERERIALAKEEAAGVQRLPDGSENPNFDPLDTAMP